MAKNRCQKQNKHAKNSNMPSLRPLALSNELLLKFEKVASEQGVPATLFSFQQHGFHKPLNKKFTVQCQGLQMWPFGTLSCAPFISGIYFVPRTIFMVDKVT